MEIMILKNAESVAAMAGELVAELLRVQPAAVLGLATGSSQMSLYRHLVEKHLDVESKAKWYKADYEKARR